MTKAKIGYKKMEVILILLFALYYILPSGPIRHSFVVPLILEMIYVLLAVLRNNGMIGYEILKYFLLFILIASLYAICTEPSSISSTEGNVMIKQFLSKFYQINMMFLPVYFLYRVKNFNIHEKKLILLFSYGVISYVVLVSIKALKVNPNIVKSWRLIAEAGAKNIAGYYFVYAVPFVVACCIAVLPNLKWWGKSLFLGISLLYIFFLVASQFALAFLICFAGILLTLFFFGPIKNKIGVIIIAIWCLVLCAPLFIKGLMATVPSEQIKVRLSELYAFIWQGNSSGYNLNGRLMLYKQTILAFLSSPIWGNRQLDFDGHATFLTVLADVGIIGSIPYYYLYISSYKKVQKILEDFGYSFVPFFFMLLLIGFTNPIQAALPLMYACWFLVPLTMQTVISVRGKFDAKVGN